MQGVALHLSCLFLYSVIAWLAKTDKIRLGQIKEFVSTKKKKKMKKRKIIAKTS